jgi:hypothetical protein
MLADPRVVTRPSPGLHLPQKLQLRPGYLAGGQVLARATQPSQM